MVPNRTKETLLSIIETLVPKSANIKIISDGWALGILREFDTVGVGTSTLPSYTKLNLLTALENILTALKAFGHS